MGAERIQKQLIQRIPLHSRWFLAVSFKQLCFGEMLGGLGELFLSNMFSLTGGAFAVAFKIPTGGRIFGPWCHPRSRLKGMPKMAQNSDSPRNATVIAFQDLT